MALDDVDTSVSLKEHFLALLAAHTDVHHILNESTILARQQLDARISLLNELREGVETDRAQFINRDAYEGKHQALSDKIDAVERGLEKLVESAETVLRNVIERNNEAIWAELKIGTNFRASFVPLMGLATSVGGIIGAIVTYLLERGLHP